MSEDQTDHPAALEGCALSLNDHVAPWVERLVADAAALRVSVATDSTGSRIVDAGIASPG